MICANSGLIVLEMKFFKGESGIFFGILSLILTVSQDFMGLLIETGVSAGTPLLFPLQDFLLSPLQDSFQSPVGILTHLLIMCAQLASKLSIFKGLIMVTKAPSLIPSITKSSVA